MTGGQVDDVTTAPSYREIVARLAAAQKASRNAPAYSRWVNRPLGRRIAAAAYLRGMTPDQVTGISACLTVVGLAFLVTAQPAFWVGVVVSLALVLGYAFDSADGQLARLRGGGSPRGEWLDHVVDSAKNVSVHLAVLVAWFRFAGERVFSWEGDTLLLVPLLFAIVSTVFFFAMTLTDQLRRLYGGKPTSTSAEAIAAKAPVMASLMTLPNDYGLLCVAFVLVGLPAVFAPFYTLFLLANVVFLVVGLRRWSGELRGKG